MYLCYGWSTLTNILLYWSQNGWYMDIKKIMFIDIETVSATERLSELSESMVYHWHKKACKIAGNEIDIEECAKLYEKRAAIYAEFGKIICISLGYLDSKFEHIKIKSFFGHDEKALLEQFGDMLNQRFNDPEKNYFCGHNIKEFDLPYIGRRMVVHQIPLPKLIDVSGKKPWEVKFLLDTMEMWRFGDFKSFISLDLLSAVLNIPSPKDDIDGSKVGEVYWKDRDLKRIVSYCEKDVVTVANVFLRMNNMPMVHKVINS